MKTNLGVWGIHVALGWFASARVFLLRLAFGLSVEQLARIPKCAGKLRLVASVVGRHCPSVCFARLYVE